MEIKLKPKQLAQLTQIQQTKQQLNQMLQDQVAREASLLEIIFEGAGITGEISNLKLDGDKITYEVVEKAPKRIAKKLKKETEKEKTVA